MQGLSYRKGSARALKSLEACMMVYRSGHARVFSLRIKQQISGGRAGKVMAVEGEAARRNTIHHPSAPIIIAPISAHMFTESPDLDSRRP